MHRYAATHKPTHALKVKKGTSKLSAMEYKTAENARTGPVPPLIIYSIRDLDDKEEEEEMQLIEWGSFWRQEYIIQYQF